MAEEQTVGTGGFGAQIGSAIKSKLTDSIRSMDVMALLQNLVAATPEDAESDEIRQKLQGVIAQYNDMSEDEKVQFAAQLKDALANKLQAQLQETPIDLSGLDEAVSRAIIFKLALVGIGAFLLFALIGMLLNVTHLRNRSSLHSEYQLNRFFIPFFIDFYCHSQRPQ